MQVLEKLQKFNWGNYDVDYVIVFGSCVKSNVYRDIDIAIKFKIYDFEKYLQVLEDLAKYLGVKEDLIDIVILNRNDIPCHLIVEIFTKGKLVYVLNPEIFSLNVIPRLNICQDFLIDFKKLNIIENALRTVKKRWES